MDQSQLQLGTFFNYTDAANPYMPPIPVEVYNSDLYKSGPTKIINLDLSSKLNIPYPCTSPNLLASFIHILEKEKISTNENATSYCFYIIKGSGSSVCNDNTIKWSKGDLFTIPGYCEIVHNADVESVIYYINDSPLLKYLGVAPIVYRFDATFFDAKTLIDAVEDIALQNNNHSNRLGVLLGTSSTIKTTKTLTHTLWSLLNKLPPKTVQKPHRHNSVALDLAISSPENGCYTLIGQELDDNNKIKNPIRVDWKTGSVFTTPPGWWHSHHNETDTAAWVLPIQDAGLHTHMRTLDIQFIS